jgi:PPM family protein phosphatase
MTGPVTRIPRPPAPTARGAGVSHRGAQRDGNEDAILTDPSGALWAVADGMGGYGHGALAAEIVIEHLVRIPHGAPVEAVPEALRAAHDGVLALARSRGVGAMGATVVVALVAPGRATIFWAGDSRGYLFSDGRLALATRDHSVVQELIDQGALSAADAEGHPQRHVVTRAVGAGDRLELEAAEVALAPGDRILLCSDGLTVCVPESEIARILRSEEEPRAACLRLVEASLARGAPDNVSVVVVAVERPGPP